MLVATAASAQGLFKRRQLPAQYVEQVSNFFSQHRWSKGKELLDQGLELYPEDANLHYLAGRYWWNGKNYDQARYHLVKACQINYHHVDAKSLLVNVEEITGNYSSAVCYVNELLEVNPYWKGLWLRKVDLYKKMGNFEEANTLLRRLSVIYPNDASINKDFFDVLETTYLQARQNGNLVEMEAALREMVRIIPTDVDYQLVYANILLRQGRYSDARDSLMAALDANPGNVDLIKKATDLLMESGQSMAALSMVRSQMVTNNSPRLRQLYENLLSESARMESETDPYRLYARKYDTDHSMEALQYLLTQSVKNGYYDDAVRYVREMRLRTGDSARLYMMEYDVYMRWGQSASAYRALEEGASRFPEDYDLNLEISRLRLRQASEEMREERWSQAIPLLTFVADYSVDEDLQAAALRRLSSCYVNTGDTQRAMECFRRRLKREPEHVITIDYSAMLVKQDKREEALPVLQTARAEATDSTARRALGNAYLETAYPYLRDKLANGAVKGLHPVCEEILAIDSTDYWGLRYALKTADDPLPYAEQGMRHYPEDLSFPIKAASVMAERGREEDALALLRDRLERYPYDDDLQKTYAGVSDQVGTKFLKEKDYARASAVLDSALAVRPQDPSARYTRGLVYEKQKQWDSAYVYQRHYVPSVLEEREFKARMDALRAHTLRHTADAGYELFRFTDNYTLTGIATVGYSQSWKQDELAARINYTGRDGEKNEDGTYASSGGQGLQFQAGWTHHFGARWSLQGNAAYGTAYFPRWNADATLTWHTPVDWDANLGALFRYLQDGNVMYGLNLGASHAWSNVYVGGKLTGGMLYNIFFVNGMARFRFYPVEGGRSYLEAQAGAGTAPEVSFLNYYYNAGAFNHLNSFVSLSASWALTYNLMLQLSGTWNTLYEQRETVNYRNLLMLHVSFAYSF